MLAASNARKLFSEKHATYARFIAFVHYPQGLRANMEALPVAWANYDLIVTASMLEYVPRKRLSDALAALRTRLADSGRLVVFITKRNWLTRLMIGWWWRSNLYGKSELLREFERAGFSHVTFKAFPLTARYLALWGYVIEAWN